MRTLNVIHLRGQIMPFSLIHLWFPNSPPGQALSFLTFNFLQAIPGYSGLRTNLPVAAQ